MEQHEFNFIQPIDPAGGSWYLEPLTEEFTQKAWAKFQEIEAHGGLIKALENNTVQIAINEVNLHKDHILFDKKTMYLHIY